MAKNETTAHLVTLLVVVLVGTIPVWLANLFGVTGFWSLVVLVGALCAAWATYRTRTHRR